MKTIDLLKKLTGAVGVSGAENCIQEVLCDILKDYGEVTTDSMHNVYCTFGEGRHFLLDAHLDEIGMIVTAISDDGFLKFDRCGGLDARMMLASEVSVWTAKGERKGVISTLPPHLQKEGDKKQTPKMSELAIDIGMSKAEAEQCVALGDRVTFGRNFTKLLGNQVSASVLDDRSGCAAIILALESLQGVPAKVTAVFTAQEEVGTRGAKVAPYGRGADEAIAVDVSFGYSPLCKKTDCGELGKGPMIGFSPILNRDMSQKLVDVATQHQIPYQKEIMGGDYTGTNADAISVSESGIPTALLSIPEKYMHSPIEVVDVTDVENTAALLAAYIKERAGE